MRYLADAQFLGLQGLWRKLCDGHLPTRCTKQWFFETFCGVDENAFVAARFDHLPANADIARFLHGFVKPYDVIALMSVLPHTRLLFPPHRADARAPAARLLMAPEYMIDASHVLKLLRDSYHEAVLYAHDRLVAAELAEARGAPPSKAARAWGDAGDEPSECARARGTSTGVAPASALPRALHAFARPRAGCNLGVVAASGSSGAFYSGSSLRNGRSLATVTRPPPPPAPPPAAPRADARSASCCDAVSPHRANRCLRHAPPSPSDAARDASAAAGILAASRGSPAVSRESRPSSTGVMLGVSPPRGRPARRSSGRRSARFSDDDVFGCACSAPRRWKSEGFGGPLTMLRMDVRSADGALGGWSPSPSAHTRRTCVSPAACSRRSEGNARAAIVPPNTCADENAYGNGLRLSTRISSASGCTPPPPPRRARRASALSSRGSDAAADATRDGSEASWCDGAASPAPSSSQFGGAHTQPRRAKAELVELFDRAITYASATRLCSSLPLALTGLAIRVGCALTEATSAHESASDTMAAIGGSAAAVRTDMLAMCSLLGALLYAIALQPTRRFRLTVRALATVELGLFALAIGTVVRALCSRAEAERTDEWQYVCGAVLAVLSISLGRLLVGACRQWRASHALLDALCETAALSSSLLALVALAHRAWLRAAHGAPDGHTGASTWARVALLLPLCALIARKRSRAAVRAQIARVCVRSQRLAPAALSLASLAPLIGYGLPDAVSPEKLVADAATIFRPARAGAALLRDVAQVWSREAPSIEGSGSSRRMRSLRATLSARSTVRVSPRDGGSSSAERLSPHPSPSAVRPRGSPHDGGGSASAGGVACRGTRGARGASAAAAPCAKLAAGGLDCGSSATASHRSESTTSRSTTVASARDGRSGGSHAHHAAGGTALARIASNQRWAATSPLASALLLAQRQQAAMRDALPIADFFVLHSAFDANGAKLRALEAWVGALDPLAPPPTVWLDVVSADMSLLSWERLAHSVASLACCRRVLLVAGPSLLDDLLVVALLHAWLALGRSIEHVDVLLAEADADEARTPVLAAFDTFAVMYARTESAVDECQIVHSVEIASVSAYNEAVRSMLPRVRAALDARAAERLAERDGAAPRGGAPPLP